jgi:hypothetical protein
LDDDTPNELKQMKWLNGFSKSDRTAWTISLDDVVVDMKSKSISFSFDDNHFFGNREYNKNLKVESCINDDWTLNEEVFKAWLKVAAETSIEGANKE